MTYLDIRNCDICGAEQVDTTILLTINGYKSVCRNCYKLIRETLKDCKNKREVFGKKFSLSEEDMKTMLKIKISERTDKQPSFFQIGSIMEILKFYSSNKALLKDIIKAKSPEGIKKENRNKEKYNKTFIRWEGKMRYEYFKKQKDEVKK